VIVVDDHITGVLSEHQGGRFLDIKPAGIRVRGRRSTPGRYLPGRPSWPGLGRHQCQRSLEIIEKIDPKQAWPGLKLLMSRHGEHSAWFELDHDLRPQPAADARAVRHVVERTPRMRAGAVHPCCSWRVRRSLRAGVTENPCD